MKLTIDFETKSKAPLKDTGVYPYAADPSTDIFCLALKVDDSEAVLYIPEKFRHLYDGPTIDKEEVESLVNEAETIEAHNMSFEKALWHAVMHKRYGFTDLPFDKLRCSAAKAAVHALPRDLDRACKAMGLEHEKDMTGRRVMLKMCKPKKPSKRDPGIWHEKPEDFKILCEYCMQDVEAEHELSKSLPELSDKELAVWRHDLEVNARGIYIDKPAITKLVKLLKDKETALLLEIQELTGGKIYSTRQVTAMLAWLAGHDILLDDLQTATVEEALKKLEGKPKRLLEIRQLLAKSSVKKLEAMAAMACNDNRIRGTLLYHGASTGRFAGVKVQPQYMPRNSYDEKAVDEIVASDPSHIELCYGEIPEVASKCVRGMLCAAPGKELLCADFSAIEARVLAWVAMEEKTLQAFRDNKDLYKVEASGIYGVPYDEVTKEQRQVGKTAVLALGYQGWLGAFKAMASTYGVRVSEDQAKEIILKWRNNNGAIVDFWKGIDNAAKRAIRETDKVHNYGLIKCLSTGGFLHIRLPSFRLLSYRLPSIELLTDMFGREKLGIQFYGMNSMTNQYGPQKTYGGKLTENIVQAIARDLLTDAMLRVEKAGYKIVLHVHDEIVVEVDKGEGGLHTFEKLMAEVPSWAEGLPLAAEGWRGRRYRK